MCPREKFARRSKLVLNPADADIGVKMFVNDVEGTSIGSKTRLFSLLMLEVRGRSKDCLAIEVVMEPALGC